MEAVAKGDPSLRLLLAWVSDSLEATKHKLVTSDPTITQRLQGEAQAYEHIMNVLTNARKIGS